MSKWDAGAPLLRMGGKKTWLTPRNKLPTCVTLPNVVVLAMSNVTSVIMEMIRRNLPTFKVTQGHWNRHGSISDLWLPLDWSIVTMGLYSVQFLRKTAISVENRKNFPTPVYLTPSLREFPLEFCNDSSAWNTRVMPLLDKCLDTIPPHRRTELPNNSQHADAR